MRGLWATLLAVAVITGWFMAAMWLVLGIAEIAAVHATHCAIASPQDTTCSR